MNRYSFTLIFSILCGLLGCSNDNSDGNTLQLVAIPESAKIIYHRDNLIFVMDENGNNETQITFDASYTLEHVALSYDRTKIVTNYFSDLSVGSQSSKMLLYDISSGTKTFLLPEFHMTGNGGVDWDDNGYIYFSGVQELPFPNATTIPEFQANAGANDIFRMKFDGTDLQNLTNTTIRGEADISVSPDSQHISYMATNIDDPENTFTEIWIRDIDGTDAELVFIGGEDRVSSVHDPEISPDGNFVVFSQVNDDVDPVFPDDPLANTAHDIIKLNLTNSTLEIVTQPGPISITPDWKGNKILFLEITDDPAFPHAGLATINPDGTGYQLIKNGTNIGKWIPD